MSETKLTKQEPENLGYYDFSAYMGVPYFHWGGLKATDRLVELLKLDSRKNLLVIGCGTGYTACYIAQNYGCQVKGIDIAEHMVIRAKERAVEMGLTDKVDFQLGDAYELLFEDHRFDSVMTEFVTLFLERNKALKEYMRVLRPGGIIGLNEIFKEKEMPEDIEMAITEAIEGWEEAVGLPFNLTSQTEWQSSFKQAGFIDILSERVDSTYS